MKTCAACGRTENEVKFYGTSKYVCSECSNKRGRISREKYKKLRIKTCDDCGKTEKETRFYEHNTRVCIECFNKRVQERISSSEENKIAKEWNMIHPYKFDNVHSLVKKLATA